MRAWLSSWQVSAGAMRRFHAIATVVWLLMAIPSMVWWHTSIGYLVFLSVYAIVASHWSCWQAARAEQMTEDNSP